MRELLLASVANGATKNTPWKIVLVGFYSVPATWVGGAYVCTHVDVHTHVKVEKVVVTGWLRKGFCQWHNSVPSYCVPSDISEGWLMGSASEKARWKAKDRKPLPKILTQLLFGIIRKDQCDPKSWPPPGHFSSKVPYQALLFTLSSEKKHLKCELCGHGTGDRRQPRWPQLTWQQPSQCCWARLLIPLLWTHHGSLSLHILSLQREQMKHHREGCGGQLGSRSPLNAWLF